MCMCEGVVCVCVRVGEHAITAIGCVGGGMCVGEGVVCVCV